MWNACSQLGYRRRTGKFNDLAVDSGAQKSVTLEPIEDVAKFAFLLGDDGREQDEAAFERERKNLVDDLLRGEAAYGFPGDRVVGLAGGGLKQSQIVVNFCLSGDSRARAATRSALLDGDGGGKSLDKVHIRLLQLVQKLARIRRKTLDITALPLGVKRVEGERAFT